MEIEILVVPDCPNEIPATEQLRRALDDVGLGDTTFVTRTVTTRAEAERAGFTGSPTVLVNGRDPFAEEGREPGLACRVYRSPQGLSGVPPLEGLRLALKKAADADLSR
ncbi:MULTISPECIES: hypothetical protein [Streptomyces]|uniref:Alkylmercury lyase n=1 Tax=Streptomyces yanii TaxID=78510 RepID=A0ABV5R6E9_9ACTN